MQPVQIKIQLLHPNARCPKYATLYSAGSDLYSIEEIIIPAGERRLVRTGLKTEIPEGYEMQIRPRSGLALKHGITLANSIGTIDSDYRNEIGVILQNNGNSSFHVQPGDRIAQAIIAELPKVTFVITEELSETERGEGGFGSTGIRDE